MVGQNGYFVNPEKACGSSWTRTCCASHRRHLSIGMALDEWEVHDPGRVRETDPTRGGGR